MAWLTIDDVGAVDAGRVTAVMRADTGGAARLLRVTPPARVVALTGGRKRRSLLVLDSGHVVVTALTVEEVVERLRVPSDA